MGLGARGAIHYAMQDTANKINTQINTVFVCFFCVVKL
jgi:hypothetical protein